MEESSTYYPSQPHMQAYVAGKPRRFALAKKNVSAYNYSYLREKIIINPYFQRSTRGFGRHSNLPSLSLCLNRTLCLRLACI